MERIEHFEHVQSTDFVAGSEPDYETHGSDTGYDSNPGREDLADIMGFPYRGSGYDPEC